LRRCVCGIYGCVCARSLRAVRCSMSVRVFPSSGDGALDGGLRACWLRVVAGSLLLACVCCVCSLVSYDFSGYAAGVVGGVNVTSGGVAWERHTLDRFGVWLGAGVCAVAFYHYKKLIEVREGSGGEVTASGEALCDCVRYCDWLVTLPVLGVELSAMFAGRFSDFVGGGALLVFVLLLLMVALGGAGRAACQGRLAAVGRSAAVSAFGARLGAVCVGFGFALFVWVLNELWSAADAGNAGAAGVRSEGWVLASFVVVPWSLYGVVASAVNWSLVVGGDDHLVARSLGSDVAYGVLDVWCKACLAFYACGKLGGVW
jgi:hypothetical protein